MRVVRWGHRLTAPAKVTRSGSHRHMPAADRALSVMKPCTDWPAAAATAKEERARELIDDGCDVRAVPRGALKGAGPGGCFD
jgi:hypothetical protein